LPCGAGHGDIRETFGTYFASRHRTRLALRQLGFARNDVESLTAGLARCVACEQHEQRRRIHCAPGGHQGWLDTCGVLSKWREVVKDGVAPDSCTADLVACLQRGMRGRTGTARGPPVTRRQGGDAGTGGVGALLGTIHNGGSRAAPPYAHGLRITTRKGEMHENRLSRVLFNNKTCRPCACARYLLRTHLI